MKVFAKRCLAIAASINTLTFVFVLLLIFNQQACTNSNEDEARINSAVFVENPDFVFAQRASLSVDQIDQLSMVSYTISTKPGNVSEDVHVSYTMDYLQRIGAVDFGNQSLTFSVFGLYADYENLVSIELRYADGIVSSSEFSIITRAFQSESPLPEITVNHIEPLVPLSFILIRSLPESPIIIDVDGETRWQAPNVGASTRAAYFDGAEFFVGLAFSNGLYRMSWNGESEAYTIGDDRYGSSHHNIEKGKVGLLNTITFIDGNIDRPESVLIEMEKTGEIIKHWDFDQILSDYIVSNGEDPSGLVQNGVDWFHMNSAIYDASDDSIIVSSRENFVIKVDYNTGNIKWILGNQDKLWYSNFPNSLQQVALQVTGNAPIGQHSLSVTADGRRLMLFNNGLGHVILPDIGDSRTFSSVSIYEIDTVLGTAHEVWSFDKQQEIYSNVCSSAYRTIQGDILINYATSEFRQVARLLVVNDDMEVLFDAAIPKRPQDSTACRTAYSVEEIVLDGLIFD